MRYAHTHAHTTWCDFGGNHGFKLVYDAYYVVQDVWGCGLVFFFFFFFSYSLVVLVVSMLWCECVEIIMEKHERE